MRARTSHPLDGARQDMIVALEHQGIRDPVVLAAMASVPRELFLPAAVVDHAYADRALAIDAGQELSRPYATAVMLDALELLPEDRVLEIGTGSGYSAAVTSQLAAHVYTIERVLALAVAARERLGILGYEWIDVRCGDGLLGWPAHAPFDAIAVTGAVPQLPEVLVRQLALDGRMVVPIGGEGVQRLVLVTKQAGARCSITDLATVRLQPLVAADDQPAVTHAP